MLKNKTALTRSSQGRALIGGTVPGCNYMDKSCLIIQ